MRDSDPCEAVLEVRDVVKTFPGVRALDGASFRLRRGEVHALVGENGAGKSTLIHILAGVHQPDSGEIVLEGERVRFPDPHASAERGIGVVFQERSLSVNLSVAENVFANRQPVTNRWLGLIDRTRLHEETSELLRLFRLRVGPGTPVRRLSAALQQLVEILKAMSARPSILILDEPTSSLSAAETELLFENIRRLKTEGLSVIYISHHLGEVFEIADRVTVLRDGRHVDTCEVGSIAEQELVGKMVGRELADLYGRRSGEIGAECFRAEAASRGSDFRDVSFSVRRGEIVGVAGLAGAGRTELGRGIFGAEPLDSGTMYLGGKPVTIRSPTEAIANRIGYLTEDRKEQGLFLEMAVRENCVAANLGAFSSRMGLVDEEAVTDFARRCREDFNIVTPGLDQKVVNLSGGNQQKVLLSMWMAVRPKLLIVDEPTRGVDVGARSEIYHRLRELAASGVGILMISSDLPEILGLSDRVLVMRNGRLVRELTSEEASEENVISHATGLGMSDRDDGQDDAGRRSGSFEGPAGPNGRGRRSGSFEGPAGPDGRGR
ncbi:MAG: sugar ABC transporter ATP-binding protein [Planctomycetota bacterium]